MFRKLLVLGLLAGLPVLTGCGATTAEAPATDTATSSSAAATSDATATSESSAEAAGSPIDQIVQAQASLKTYSMVMSMTMDMGGEVKTKVDMTVDQSDPSNVKMKGSTSFSGMEMNLIVIGGTTYLKNPLSGNKWEKLSSSEAGQYETNTDMSKTLEQLKGALSNTENLGADTVDGVATTHYRFTVDTSAYNKELGDAGVVTGDDFSYDIWVDAEGQMRKISSKMTMKVQDQTVTTDFTGTISGFNEPVTIEAPKVG